MPYDEMFLLTANEAAVVILALTLAVENPESPLTPEGKTMAGDIAERLQTREHTVNL